MGSSKFPQKTSSTLFWVIYMFCGVILKVTWLLSTRKQGFKETASHSRKLVHSRKSNISLYIRHHWVLNMNYKINLNKEVMITDITVIFNISWKILGKRLTCWDLSPFSLASLMFAVVKGWKTIVYMLDDSYGSCTCLFMQGKNV